MLTKHFSGTIAVIFAKIDIEIRSTEILLEASHNRSDVPNFLPRFTSFPYMGITTTRRKVGKLTDNRLND